MENKETWLDSIYNHPKRDDIILAYISTYRGYDEDLEIDSATMTKDSKNRDVMAVVCSSHNTFGGEQTERVKETLYLGEYFRYTESKPEPIYLFNEILSIAGGKNTHHWVAILEQLNIRKAINHETFISYIRKESKKCIEELYDSEEEKNYRKERLDEVVAVMRDRIKSDNRYAGLIDNFPTA